MQYQYQIDYGNGYQTVFPDRREGGENPSKWLAEVETELAVQRARVLLGNEIVEERDFTCTVTQNSIEPDGSTEYLVQCNGRNFTVKRQADGELTGEADIALERVLEAVRKLNESSG